MQSTTTKIASGVPPEEEERRIAEYRDLGFKRGVMPHIIYHGAQIVCPWPDCGYQIAGIDFQLEKMPDKTHYTQLMTAWWQGPGVVGSCPGCSQYVLFDMNGKHAVKDPNISGAAALPDDWAQTAYVI